MGFIIGLVSICLNIVAFYWILLLTQRVKVLEEEAGQSDVSQIQDQLEAHLQDLRIENARVVQEIDALLNKEKTASAATPHEDTKASPVESHHESPTSAPIASEANSNEPEWEPPLDLEEPIDVMETSMLSRILQLQKEGLNSEEIAKRLGLGKGEVALMLKLHEKK